MNSSILDSYKELNSWLIKNGPYSYDVSDLKAKPFFRKAIHYSHKGKFWKILTAPFIIISEKYLSLFRKLFNVKKEIFPQGQAIIASAYFQYYIKTNDETSLNEAIKILEWLKKNRSKKYKNYCWGQPYDWFSRKLFPAYTPRATVTTQVAMAFLDAYEITKNKLYLNIAISACNFFIDDLNWEYDNGGDICFSYTTIDNYNIHNASMLVAATLIRTWYFSKNDNYKKYGIKALKFTIKHQNENGSWFYWAPPDKILGRIDHYHTGFVLESLLVIRKYLKNEFEFEKALKKGLNFYLNNLFTIEMIPKMTDKSTYPIDIQSCAQAIITLKEAEIIDASFLQKAQQVAMWTVKNLKDNKGYFYYRIYKNGKIDKTPYIRWSESWMLRALSLLI